MDLRTVKTFQVAAGTLSFTQTAGALNLAQSTVTAQMKGLEELLRVPLFDRLGNRLRLTEPGERFRTYADRLLNLAEEARAAVCGGVPSGEIALTAAETVCTYMLPPIFQEFKKRCPEVAVRFVPMPVREFKRSLLEGTIDLAFILEEDFPPGALHVETLRSEPLAVVVAKDHRLRKLERVTARDLISEAVLFTGLGCSYRNKFERTLIRAGALPKSRMEFESVEAIKRCVMCGLGVAALPLVAVKGEIEAGQLFAVNWADERLDVSTHLAWSASRWHSPALAAFIETARAKATGPRPGRASRNRVSAGRAGGSPRA